MKTVIKKATIGEKAAILDFIKVAYENTEQHKVLKRWAWEYLENPSLSNGKKKELPIWLAIKENRIVGQICGIPVEIKTINGMSKVVGGVDLIVLPACRGEGVGQRLIQAIAEHYGFYMAISMSDITRRIYGRLEHYNDIDAVSMYRRFVKLDKASVFRYFMKKTKNRLKLNLIARFVCRIFLLDSAISLAVNPVLWLRNVVERVTKRDTQTVIREVERFGDEIDRLWNKANHKFKVIVKRGKEYLNWRFSDCPLGYCSFIAMRDDEAKGYIVLRKPEPTELNVGIIVDLFADPDDHETIEDLICHAIQFFGTDVAMIECATSQKEYQNGLSKFGFLKMEETVPVVYCKNDKLRNKLEQYKKNWFLTKADHDWDQLRPV